MIARTEREARRNAAIMERRRAFLERWSQPKIKKAYNKMGDHFALLYEQGGEGRMKALSDEPAKFMEEALIAVYSRVALDIFIMAKGSTKGAIQDIEKKDATDEELGIAYNLLLQNFADQAVAQAGFIVETLGTEIAVMLATEEGLVASGPAEVAKAIRARTQNISPARSILIARTEVVSSASESQEKFIEELWDPIEDGQMYKRWHAVSGSRTRDDHRKMNGKILPKDQLFQVGRDRMKYPGDRSASAANLCNCRCSISYLPEELVHSSQRVQQEQQDSSPTISDPFKTDTGVEIGDSQNMTIDEKELHNVAKWSKNSDVVLERALKKTSPISEVFDEKEQSPYYDPSSKSINLPKEYKRDRSASARHEFGHHMDKDIFDKLGGVESDIAEARFFTDSRDVMSAAKVDADIVMKKIPAENSLGSRSLEISSLGGKDDIMKYARDEHSGFTYDLYKHTTGRDLFDDLGELDSLELSNQLAHMPKGYMGLNMDDSSRGSGVIRVLRNLARRNGFNFNEDTSLPRFSDFIESLTVGEKGSGHGKRYYTSDKEAFMGQTEAFAEYVAELGGKDPDAARRLFYSLAPNMVKTFDAGLRTL